MLREISVENLAIIESARIEFSGRLIAITGETGAGKSLVVDAIGLALGDRAESAFIRTGAAKCVITAVFDLGGNRTHRTDRTDRTNQSDLSDRSDSSSLLYDHGIELEDGCLYLAREIAEGRSQCRINARPVQASVAKSVGELLVDLHGQHEHQSLVRPSAHRDLLDAWIGPEASQLRQKLAAVCAELRATRSHIEELEGRSRERERLIDLYRYEVEEIDGAELVPAEEVTLNADRKRMLNAEKLATEVGAAIAAMSESEALSSAEAALDRAAQLDDAMQSIAEQIQSAIIHIQEAHSSLEQYLGTLEFDPERLQMVADRLDLIGRLKRKYGATIEEVLAYGSKTRVALAELEANEETMTALLGSEQKQSALVLEFADKLSALRKKASKQFATAIASQLRELAMESASFEVSLAPKAPDSTGAEAIEFLFSANPGHPPQPLTKIASGGEMSRVMLALRCVLAGASPAPTLVFDEIDGGLGGQTATVVGAKLRELSKHSQVIVITHLPQIAGLADEHFDVEKRAQDGATHVSLSRLEGEARVAALARMLGGSAVAQVALDHARELLKS